MTEHTPGPWVIYDWFTDPDGFKTIRIANSMAHTAKIIANTYSNEHARLIAAAPELLTALENAMSLINAFTGPDNEIANAMRDQARAAITKAKGTAP